MDRALAIITSYGLERFRPHAPILLFPQTIDGVLVDHGGPLLQWTANLLADRASLGGMAIGYLEHIILAAAFYDPLHDEWNMVTSEIRCKGCLTLCLHT